MLNKKGYIFLQVNKNERIQQSLSMIFAHSERFAPIQEQFAMLAIEIPRRLFS